jgi:hypothetical protein
VTVTLSVVYGTLTVDPGDSDVIVTSGFPNEAVLVGTVAEIEALLNSDPNSAIDYTYDLDYPLPPDTLAITIDDGVSIGSDTAQIVVTPVNDAPLIDLDDLLPGTGSIAIHEFGSGPTYLAYYAIFDDDNVDWDGAKLTVAISGGAAGDQLTIEDIGTGTDEISLSGSDLLFEGDVVGTWSGGGDGAPLEIVFNDQACACAIELTIASILYENDSASPAITSRDVTFTFVDGDGTALSGSDTGSATARLNVFPAPSSPLIDEGAPATGPEDTAIALTGISITDDGDPVTGLLTVHLGVEHGTLVLRTDVPGGVTAATSAGAAVVPGTSRSPPRRRRSTPHWPRPTDSPTSVHRTPRAPTH